MSVREEDEAALRIQYRRTEIPLLALSPGPSPRGGAWYTLFAHAKAAEMQEVLTLNLQVVWVATCFIHELNREFSVLKEHLQPLTQAWVAVKRKDGSI